MDNNNPSIFEEQFESLKKEWIGQRIEITEPEHPWQHSRGEVISFDETHIGIGIKIKLDDDDGECYVFKGRYLKKL